MFLKTIFTGCRRTGEKGRDRETKVDAAWNLEAWSELDGISHVYFCKREGAVSASF